MADTHTHIHTHTHTHTHTDTDTHTHTHTHTHTLSYVPACFVRKLGREWGDKTERGEGGGEDDPFMVFTSVHISITHSHFLLPV